MKGIVKYTKFFTKGTMQGLRFTAELRYHDDVGLGFIRSSLERKEPRKDIATHDEYVIESYEIIPVVQS